MKKILLIATGGTIASVQTENGLKPAISPEMLLSYIPNACTECDIDVKQIFNIDSTNIQPEHWMLIVREIESSYDSYDGFLITHGTDTMAYTASALSYLIQGASKPIVLTGAQKPISDEFTDARRNLSDSINFILNGGLNGIFIVFDGKAILGTRARKIRSKSFAAFDSIGYPIAAFIDDNRIIKYLEAPVVQGEVRFAPSISDSVFLLKLIPGIRPEILAYLGEHYDIIVIESYGVGGIPFYDKRNFMNELRTLTEKGKIIVIATQVMLEGSDAEKYEVGALALDRYNVLQSFDMTVESAVTKLMWLCAEHSDYEEIRDGFYTCINHDLLYEPKNQKRSNLKIQ